jgi:GST-like protein
MSIQLFAFDTPNGRKISVALEEMGLPYQVQVVNITKDDQFKPDFLSISPMAGPSACLNPVLF